MKKKMKFNALRNIDAKFSFFLKQIQERKQLHKNVNWHKKKYHLKKSR